MKRTKRERFLKDKFDEVKTDARPGKQKREERRLWKRQMTKVERRKNQDYEDLP